MEELKKLRYEVLNLRNMNEITTNAETKLLHKLNALQEAINYTRCSTQLLCVSEVKGIGLTKGLEYKTDDTKSFYFTITNDYGEICEYHKSKFEVVSE